MKGYLEQNGIPTPDNPVEIETIEIPLQKATYEDIQALNIDLQTKLLVKDKEIERLNNIINKLEEYILNHYIVGHIVQNASLDDILNKLKELKEGNNENNNKENN